MDSFYKNSAKKFFAFYGVAQMGKSYVIREKWLEGKNYRYPYARFMLDETVDVVAYFLEELGIQSENEPSEVQLKRLFSKHQSSLRSKIFYFENVESLLLLKVGNSQHRLIEPFEILLRALSNYQVKVVLESRYEIDFDMLRNQVAFLEKTQLQALPPEHYREKYEQLGFTKQEFEALYGKTAGNTWFMERALPAFLEEDSVSKQDFLENILNKPFERYQNEFLQKTFETLDDNQDLELLLRAAFAYGDIRYADFEDFKHSFQTLRKKLLLNKISDEIYTINGFVRETCRIYFATTPLMQKVEREEKQKVGKTNRLHLTAAQRIDKYAFLTKQDPHFIPYFIELAKAQQENGQIEEAQEKLRECLNKKDIFNKSRQVIYSCLIHLCATFEQAQEVFEKMTNANIKP
ncbi:hypothetical protein, partial [Hugenholtzia roseola]|uniref:hypothetical protein n=1 Tax=Hugenholtzia roseola TaxID=1002 RepID=UPI0012B5539F